MAGQSQGFSFHFLFGEGDPEDRVIAGKAAVSAVVNALVAEVQRCEESDGLSEPLAGEGLGPSAQFLQSSGGLR